MFSESDKPNMKTMHSLLVYFKTISTGITMTKQTVSDTAPGLYVKQLCEQWTFGESIVCISPQRPYLENVICKTGENRTEMEFLQLRSCHSFTIFTAKYIFNGDKSNQTRYKSLSLSKLSTSNANHDKWFWPKNAAVISPTILKQLVQ